MARGLKKGLIDDEGRAYGKAEFDDGAEEARGGKMELWTGGDDQDRLGVSSQMSRQRLDHNAHSHPRFVCPQFKCDSTGKIRRLLYYMYSSMSDTPSSRKTYSSPSTGACGCR